MGLYRVGRVLLALVLLITVLALGKAASVAQDLGSYLTEPVAANAIGPDAVASLQDAGAFSLDGGTALFDPAGPTEEVFEYASVDPETGRLVGLVREAPVDHPSGTFVQVSNSESTGGESASPLPLSTALETANPLPSSEGDDNVDAAAVPSQTNLVDEVVEAVEGVADPCSEALADCESVIGDPGDPCDPNDSGQTCLEYVKDRIAAILDNGRCDPYGTGQSCDQYIVNTLASLIQRPSLFCEDFARDFVGPDATEEGCVAFILALDPDNPPQDCTSRIEYSLICSAYALTQVATFEVESNLPPVPAAPSEVEGVPLPPPASGSGSNLDCSFWRSHKVRYGRPPGRVNAWARAKVDWCGNDGTNRVRYWTPSYDVWIRPGWQAIFDIWKDSSGDECNSYDPKSDRCYSRREVSVWEVWRGSCPYCYRNFPQPVISIVGTATGVSNSDDSGW